MSGPLQLNEQREKLSSPPIAVKSGEGGNFLFWVAALAFVLVIFLHSSLFRARGLVSADGIFNFLPWAVGTNRPSNSLLSDQYLVFIPQQEFTHREFMQGRFPLWNPNLECGMPNLASIQGALLFPINLLFLPLGPFYAGAIVAFLKLFFAGLFTMLYMRLLGASNSGAFLSGLVFSLSGFMVCWLGHPHVNCAMCLPVLLYLIEKSFQYGSSKAEGLMSAPGLRVWVGLAVAFGCILLGEHPPTMVQVTIFVGFYFLFRLIREQKPEPLARAGLLTCAGLVGVFLAAPQLFPFLEYHRYSAMDAYSVALNRPATRLPLNTLILYLFPHLSGSPRDGCEETMLSLGIGSLMPNFVERTGYVGVLPLLFAICAIFLRRSRWILFYGFSALLCMLAAYGMPPFPALFGALPILRDINPTRLIMIAGFSVAVLAGFGWDDFIRLDNRQKKIWLVAGFWTVVGCIILWYCHLVGPVRWKHLDANHRSFLEAQFFMLMGSLAASATLLLPPVSKRLGLCSMIALGWVAADLYVFGVGLNPTILHKAYYPSAPSIEWLQKDKTDFRVFAKEMVLAPNTAELYGLKDARGYDFTTVRRYEELIEGGATNFFFYRTALTLPEAFPLFGVKYVLTFNPPAPDPALFDLVYSNEISIYRNRDFHGRVMTVFDYSVEQDPAAILTKVRSGKFDPQKTLLLEEEPKNAVSEKTTATALSNSQAHVASEQPDEVTVEASMSRPGFLLLLDTYFPGWKATVNGSQSPILRADYNFRAVQLPAGNAVVRFIYQPQSFRLGMAFFFTGLVILAVALLGSFWTARRSRSGTILER